MKQIVITVDDKLAKVVSELLIDQTISFSVVPVNSKNEPVLRAPRKRAKIEKPHRGKDAVFQAGLQKAVFQMSDVSKNLVAAGLSESSSSPTISKLKSEGLVETTKPGFFRLTDRGIKEAGKGKFANGATA